MKKKQKNTLTKKLDKYLHKIAVELDKVDAAQDTVYCLVEDITDTVTDFLEDEDSK